MATLTQVRLTLANDLGGLGFKAYDHVPASLTPPCVLISTGDPYVTEADKFDEATLTAHLELFAIVGTATNAVATSALDSMITKIILHTAEWTFEGASAPFMATVNASQFLTSRLAFSRVFTFEGA